MTETDREDVIDAEQARLMLAEAEAHVIDIRGADEFADRRIPGSRNHPDPAADSLSAERLPTQPSPDVEQGESEPPKLPGAGV